MSERKPEERSWETGDPDTAIVDLKDGIERLRAHVRRFRAVTAADAEAESRETT